MAASVVVSHVRRPSAEVIAYGLRRGREVRKLMLYRIAPISAAGVMDERDVPIALLFAVDPPDGQAELRVLVHFARQQSSRPDNLTSSILEPAFIRGLKLPAAQKLPHWKNSPQFALSRKGPRTVDVGAKPLSSGAIAKDSLEDWFCNPSLTVQLNSALNACFRQVCDYIKCTKSAEAIVTGCFQEAQTVNAFCFAQG